MIRKCWNKDKVRQVGVRSCEAEGRIHLRQVRHYEAEADESRESSREPIMMLAKRSVNPKLERNPKVQ